LTSVLAEPAATPRSLLQILAPVAEDLRGVDARSVPASIPTWR